MTATHTPGPWYVSRGAQADAFAIEAAAKTVAHIKTLREAEANARLIAASPEMYDALRRMVQQFEHVYPAGSTLSYGRAALARAEGRTP